MINFGDSLRIAVICPDCQKPMNQNTRLAYPTIANQESSDFTCVVCATEDCMSRYFISTIEKKSGKVIYTNARYRMNRASEDWEPLYEQYVDAKGNAVK